MTAFAKTGVRKLHSKNGAFGKHEVWGNDQNQVVLVCMSGGVRGRQGVCLNEKVLADFISVYSWHEKFVFFKHEGPLFKAQDWSAWRRATELPEPYNRVRGDHGHPLAIYLPEDFEERQEVPPWDRAPLMEAEAPKEQEPEELSFREVWNGTFGRRGRGRVTVSEFLEAARLKDIAVALVPAETSDFDRVVYITDME